jgi:hypothetical protein
MPNTAPDTALAVIEQPATAVVEWNLDDFPTERFNRLIPTQTIAMPTDLFRPVVQVVQLNPDPNGTDVYHSSDMKPGFVAPTRVALRKLATAAGISILNEHRVDDGSDPNVCEMTCEAEMVLPTGQRLRAPGTKRIDVRTQKFSSDAHRDRFVAFLQEQAASRAQNRAVRALLSLSGSYPSSEISKPFAVVSIAPNMAHPEVRARILDAMGPAIAQVYGPPPAKQLGSGAAVVNVTPAPDDDEQPPAPTALPGEKLARAEPAEEQPAWLAGPEEQPAERKPALLENLRSSAEASNLQGPPTKPQRDRLAGAFDGLTAAEINAGFRVAFGWSKDRPLTAAQAQAVITAADSYLDGFLDAWRAMAQAEAAAA